MANDYIAVSIPVQRVRVPPLAHNICVEPLNTLWNNLRQLNTFSGPMQTY